VIVRRFKQNLAGSVEVFLKSLGQSFRSVELRNDVGPGEFVPNVVVPDRLAVG